MLILFTGQSQSAPQSAEPAYRMTCEFVDHVPAYTARHLAPGLADAFEQHLIHCGPCQRAVFLGRISNPSTSHNRSAGRPCAAQTRRKT